MDTTTKIDTNSLLNLGVDPNLHPLLAATSIYSSGLATAQTQLFAPVDPLLVGYATPLVPASSILTTLYPLVQPSSSQTSPTAQIAAALATTTTRDTLLAPLLIPTASILAQPALTATAAVVAPPLLPIHSFAIQAGGIVTFNKNSDLDGNPLDLSDDAFVYAGKGFILNGTSILPVQRDAVGNALTDGTGKLRLIDQALVVAPGYNDVKINSNTNYTNLNPPQIVTTQTIVIPSYNDVKSQELSSRTPAGATTVNFNIQLNPINTATQWGQKFPPAGTATQPTVVRVTNGGLNIPENVNLSNYIITVDSGDINFNGNSNLTNVVLIATNGNVNLNQIQTENSSILANGRINANSVAKFGGNTLLANGQGDITFNKATTGTTTVQNLQVVSQGRITFNDMATVRGNFRSVGTFYANGTADIFGTVASQADIVFNRNSTFTYTNTGNTDTTPPTITAKLALDTGASSSDKITNERTISGKVTDISPIATFKAGFNATPAASWTNVTTSLQADGTFTFNPTQLNQIYGGTIPDGTHTLRLSATDSFGNQSSFDYVFTLDTTVNAPSLQLATASDTGASNSDKITKLNTPTISGTGEIGATIKVSEGTVILGQTTVGTDGKWQVATSTLANGNHSLIATATDLAGNISAASAPLSLVIDTLLSQLTLTNSITANPLKNNAKLTGTVNGTGSNLASINYAWDNGTTLIPIMPSATGGFDQGLDFTGISNGAHILTIAATDLAGNVTTTNYNVTVAVDKQAPVITAKLATDTGSSSTDKITFNPTISGMITDASQITGFKASFDGTNYVNILAQKQTDGTFTLAKTQLETIAGKALIDGNYTLHLIATDEFGNASLNYDTAFTLDTTIAVPANLKLAASSDTGASNSDNITKINTPVITGTGEIGATIKIAEGSVTVGQTTVASDGTWQVATSVLTNGTHSLTASAIDLAGNISTASAPLSLVIDALLPQLTLTTPIDANPLQNNAKLLGSIDSTGSNLTSINYRWDNSTTLIPIVTTAAGGFNQGLNFTGISNGAHTVTIIATDVAGNILTSNYNVNVNVDNIAPIVNLQLAADTGSSVSDKITNNPAIVGKVTDPSGVSAVTVSLNAGFTNSKNITTSLQSDGSFSLDKATLTQLNGGTLLDGNYQVYLQATDTFGNTTTPQTLAFQLLTQATLPTNVQLQAGSDTGASNSDKITKNNQPTIQGNGKAGDTIQLLEGATLLGQTTVGTDGKWQVTTSALANGSHSLIATATDLAGNISTASTPLSLVVDTLLPLLNLTNAIDTTPLKNDTKLIGTIDPTGSGLVGIVYNWDNSSNLIALSPNASGKFDKSLDFTGINNGAHTLTITASDVAGNISINTYNVNVALDKSAPIVELRLATDTGTSNSDLLTNDPTILGKVTDASNIVEFRASFDGANYTDIRPQLAADGSFTLSKAQLATIAGRSLSDGNYTLSLSAKDEFGNITPTTTLAFTLDTTAPTTPNFKNTVSSLNSGKIDLTGQAEVGTIVTLNNGNTNTTVDRSGNFYFDAVGLTVGNNNFTISTSDLAGNKSTSQAINIERIASNPDLVLKWNKILLAAITADRTPPPAAARRLAMLHAAIFDAVNAVTHTYNAYRVDLNASSGTSAEAAVAAAAHRILTELYPQQRATFDTAYNVDLANIPDTPGELDGVRLGREVADAMLTWRRNDGAETIEDEYVAAPTAGKWQPTAAGGFAVLPEWGEVAPFALDTGSQFRPVAPPNLTSEAYTNDFNQVKELGKIDSTTRTAEQTQIARFWADGLGTYTPSGHWNQIAEQAALREGNTLIENAQLFAALNVSLADAGIAAWDTKYTYELWRPITAIQQANTDDNPNTLADTTWRPLISTPLFPEYVSGHSTFSGAAATILTNAFGSNYQFDADTVNPTLTGITRRYNSFQAAAGEASDSRIYGGIHFKTAGKEGLKLGDNIANYVLEKNFRKATGSARISLALANDTGDTRDRITNIPAIAASLNSLPADSFRVLGGFGDNFLAYADLTADVGNDGKLLFAPDRLSAVNGGSLADGKYTFNLQIVDSNKNILQTGSLSFTLDRTAPILNLSNLVDGANLIVGSALSGTLDGTGSDMLSLSYQIDNGAIETIPLEREFTAIERRLPIENLSAGAHTLTVTGRDTAGNTTTQSYRVNTDPALPFQLAGYNPANGALDVGSTFRPQIFFSHSVDASTLTADSLYATFNGAKLAARIVPSTDGKWAWLYFQNPLPSSARIQVTVDGNLIRAANGNSLLDADVNGTPGGKTTFSFDTVSLTPVPGTRLTGIVADPGADQQANTLDDRLPGADGQLHTDDDVYKNPLAGVKVTILGMEDSPVYTDANGRFTFESAPIGDVKLAIDGRTATGISPTLYFPEMVLDVSVDPGVTNYAMTNMPEIYLPRISRDIFTDVASTGTTIVNATAAGTPELTPEQRQYLRLEVDGGSAIGENGLPVSNVRVGVATVPPDLVRDMLPPGVLQHTFDITIQANGVANFATPAKITIPNVFDAPPGTQLNILSFDHTTGKLVIDGTATVSADGLYVTSDPGSGITRPGWHGVTPPGGCGFGSPPPMALALNNITSVTYLSSEALPLLFGEVLSVSLPTWTAPPVPTPGPAPLPPGCAGSPAPANNVPRREIKIEIDGPLRDFMKKAGDVDLIDQTILLQQGIRNSATFEAETLKYQSMFGGIDNISRDRLYGSRIKVSDTLINTDGSRVKTVKDYYLYRWVGALDAQLALAGGGLTAVFARTLADGAGGFARTKDIDIRQGLNMKTNFNSSSNEFRYPLLLRGVDRAQWVFDPILAGSKTDTITIKANDTIDVGQLTAKGTATAPTTININLDGYKLELSRVLQAMVRNPGNDGQLNTADDGFKYTLAGGTTIDASPKFIRQFASFLPGDNPTVTQLNTKLQKEANDLAVAVEADYLPVNVSSSLIPGYRLVTNAGDVTMNWFDVRSGGFFGIGGADVYGSANFDSDMYTIGALLPRNVRISESAKQIVLGEAINQSVRNSGQFGVGININWTNNITFAQYVANTVSHEIGHTFGLLDAYYRDPSGRFINTNPPDIMMGGNPNDRNLTFDVSNKQLLAAALGMQNNGDLPITAGLQTYRLNYNHNNPNPFLRNNNPLSRDLIYSTSPEIIISDLNSSLFNGDRLDFDPIAADGSGGLQQVKTISIYNVGFDTLNLTSLNLANGNSGFSILDRANIPTSLAVGETTQIQIAFDPTAIGIGSDRLTIQSNASQNATLTIDLNGEGISLNSVAQFQLDNNNLGGVLSNSNDSVNKVIGTLTNRGSIPLEITDIRVVDGSDAFTLIGIPSDLSTKPIRIDRGNSFEIPAVRFAANRLGLIRGAIEVTTNDPKASKIRIGVVGTGVAATIYPEWGQDYIAVETPDLKNSPVLRTKSDNRGNFQLFLPPEQFYRFSAFDPVTGLIGTSSGLTPQSGRNINLSGSAVFGASTAADRDYDGLPDDIEIAVGSNPNRVDTNRDGIDDFTAIQRGIEVLGKNALPFGIVGSIKPLAGGNVRDVVAERDTAYLAAGSGGLQIVDLTRIKQPIIVSSISASTLGGEAIALANSSIDANTEVSAIVTNNGKLAIVNVTDRDRPVLKANLNLGGIGTSIDIVDRTAYVGLSNGQVAIVDLKDERLIARFNAGSSIKQVIGRGDTLYILTGGSFAAYDIKTNFIMPPLLSQVNLSGAAVSVGNDRAYITTNGFIPGRESFITLDLSNPRSIGVLPTNNNVNLFGKGAIVDTGSGNVLVAGNALTTIDDLKLDLYNNSNGNFAFIGEFDTPGTVSDLWIQDGLALIADGNGGLSIFNYLEPDTANVAPTISILPQGVVNNNSIVGSRRMRVDIRAVDDVQVRNVSLNVNGQNLTPDGSAPFSFYIDVPPLSSGIDSLQLEAIATDTGGNSTTSQLRLNIVADLPPTVSILPQGVVNNSIVEGQRMRVDLNAVDDIGVRNVSLSVNGRNLTPDGSAPFSYYIDVPRLSSGSDSLQLEAIVTDTGGNSTTSQLRLNIVADTSAPQIIETPNGSSVAQLRDLSLRFDKSVTLDNGDGRAIRLVEAGIDRVFNTTDDRLIPIENISNIANSDTIDIRSSLAGIGRYQLQIDRTRVRNAFDVSWGTGIETFDITATGLYPLASASSTTLASGDLNNDSYSDLVVGNSAGGITTLTTNTYGAIVREQNSLQGISVNSTELTDINQDGKLDAILVLSGNGYGYGYGYGSNDSIGISLGNGDGTFADTPTEITIPDLAPNAFELGNLNGDTYTDLVAYSTFSSQISLLSGSNTGFTFQSTFDTGTPINSLTVGDVNNDGKLDLIVAKSNSELQIWLNQGNNTFTPGTSLSTGNYPSKVVVADFDRDGFTDIAAVSNVFGGGYTTGVSLWYGSNNGTFSSRTDYATNYATTDLVVGDFNNDGYLDLATANSYTNTFSVLNNQRNRNFAPTVNYYSQGSIRKLQLIDWNRDGRLDIVSVNDYDRLFTPYLGNGDGTIDARVAPPFVDGGGGGGDVFT